MKETGDWTTPRRVGAAFGVFFIIVAILILAVTDRTAEPLVAAGGVGLLGADALLAAVRGTRSLLSKIGPMP